MSAYREQDIVYETRTHWVLAVGKRGFEVYEKGITHSTRVAAIGNGEHPRLGLSGAIAVCDKMTAKGQS